METTTGISAPPIGMIIKKPTTMESIVAEELDFRVRNEVGYDFYSIITRPFYILLINKYVKSNEHLLSINITKTNLILLLKIM